MRWSGPPKKQKRVHAVPEDTLEGAIGALDETGGVDVAAVEEGQVKPIVMSAEDVAMANRLDAANLQVIRFLIAAGLIYLLYDYLSRFNSYFEAYMPLPLPAALVNSVTPLPAIQIRSPKPRRDMLSELEFIARHGGSFLYLADSPEKAEASPPVLRIWSTVRAAFSGEMSATSTRAPSLAKQMAIALPVPTCPSWLPPPVTTATLPANLGC